MERDLLMLYQYHSELGQKRKYEADATGRVSAFISYCNSCGYSAGVYSNSGTFTDGYVEVNSLADYVPYWVADFSGSNNDFTNSFPNSHVAGWQYSSTRVTPYWQWGLDSSIFY